MSKLNVENNFGDIVNIVMNWKKNENDKEIQMIVFWAEFHIKRGSFFFEN